MESVRDDNLPPDDAPAERGDRLWEALILHCEEWLTSYHPVGLRVHSRRP